MSVAWVGAGIAAVGTVGGIISGNKAANAQQDAANASLQLQRESQQAALEAQKPFLEGGYAATNRLLDLLGLSKNTGAQGFGSLNTPFSFTPGDLTQTPGYQFQLQQGQEALDRKAAAGGGFYSGAALKAATGFNQNLASTTFDNEYNRAFNAYQTNRANTLNPLQALAGQGQTSANTVGGIQTGGANALTSLMTGLGNSQAANAINTGNQISSGLNSGLSAWQQANYLSQLSKQPRQSTWGTPGLNNFFFGNGTSGD